MKRRIVFILTLIFSLAINLVSMHYGIFNIAQHLFYITIILGVFFFEKKGVFLSLFVSALYVGTVLIYDSDYSDLPQTVVRAFILIFIAVLIDWMIARYKNKESEIEAFFNINAEMMCVSGHDGNFLRVNRAFEDVLGYGKEEFEHYSFTELIHPDDLVTTSKAMARLKDSGQVTEYVNRCRCRDGSYKYIEWRSFPFRDVVYSTARDITERTRLIHQLKSNENRMKFAEDLANIGSWEMNPETEEFRWSQGMYRILGLNPGLSMPGIGLMKELIDPDDWENVEKIFKRNSGNPNDFDFEARFRRPDGNLRWIHSKGMLFLDGAGEKQKYFGFFMDITDRKAAEKIQKQNLAGYKSLMEIYQHKADSEKELLTYIVSQAVGLTGSRGGAIYFCDEKAGRMFMAAGAGEDQIRFGKSVAFDASCAAARAYRERRRIMLNRASGDVGGADKSPPMLAVPVFDGESVVAVAAVADKTLAYDESDGWLLLMMMRNVWELVLRRRTELRFFRERQWFETTLLSIGDGVIATDADGIIRLVNKKAETLTGFPKED
ncbi:MAG TPA: PAS domain S-box protein, partial [Clostridia bacterium]|nr:PAS domain S-box protein [Clostridia bacterium]